MCFAHSQRTSVEELEDLGWRDLHDPQPMYTYEEIMTMFYENQWEIYQELHERIDQAGGELTLTHYTRFLLEELEDGLYWDELGFKLVSL